MTITPIQVMFLDFNPYYIDRPEMALDNNRSLINRMEDHTSLGDDKSQNSMIFSSSHGLLDLEVVYKL